MKTTFVLLLLFTLASCKTVHFDKQDRQGPDPKSQTPTTPAEEAIIAEAEKQYYVEQELKEIDVETTVIYIDRPVYSPAIPPKEEAPKVTGAQAVKNSTASALQIPQEFTNGVMYYAYDETFEYEIHTQPYRTTDLMLEPGEEVLEMPFLSEAKVWEIGAGISRKDGKDVQHFFLKPSVTQLTTSMIIITNKRVYHLLLKSYADRYMVMVQWNYPPEMVFHVKTNAMEELANRINGVKTETGLVNPEMLSFDYKMTYSFFKKPLWLPQRVYDDGAKTYLQLDERMLHQESPVLFNHNNERINYRVQANIVIIDELIEKVTLIKGKERVTVTKKKYKEPK